MFRCPSPVSDRLHETLDGCGVSAHYGTCMEEVEDKDESDSIKLLLILDCP